MVCIVHVMGFQTHAGSRYGSARYGSGSSVRHPCRTHTHVIGLGGFFAVRLPLDLRLDQHARVPTNSHISPSPTCKYIQTKPLSSPAISPPLPPSKLSLPIISCNRQNTKTPFHSLHCPLPFYPSQLSLHLSILSLVTHYIHCPLAMSLAMWPLYAHSVLIPVYTNSITFCGEHATTPM